MNVVPLDKKVFLSENNFSAGASMSTGSPVVLMFLCSLLFPKPGDSSSLGFMGEWYG